jgi:hypothetical protein
MQAEIQCLAFQEQNLAAVRAVGNTTQVSETWTAVVSNFLITFVRFRGQGEPQFIILCVNAFEMNNEAIALSRR